MWQGSLENFGHIENIEPGADMAKRWREYSSEYDIHPHLVCDGRRIYQSGPVTKNGQTEYKDGKQVFSDWELMERIPPLGRRHTAASSRYACQAEMVELCAYPANLNADLPSKSGWGTIHLDPQGQNGPAGSVRLELILEASSKEHGQRREFWLDPNRGYVLLREEMSCLNPDSTRKQWIDNSYEFDGFCQSPRGVWYPTIIRWHTDLGVQTRYYHLDFDVELPDELFTPK